MTNIQHAASPPVNLIWEGYLVPNLPTHLSCRIACHGLHSCRKWLCRRPPFAKPLRQGAGYGDEQIKEEIWLQLCNAYTYIYIIYIIYIINSYVYLFICLYTLSHLITFIYLELFYSFAKYVSLEKKAMCCSQHNWSLYLCGAVSANQPQVSTDET